MPQLDCACEGQHRDGGHVRCAASLHDDDDPPFGEAVCHHPAKDRKGEQTKAEPGSHGRKSKGTVVEGEHLEHHDDGPHAGAEDLDTDRREHQPIVAGGERA